MPDFTVTDDLIAKIATRFGTTEGSVKRLHGFYQNFASGMKQQYLAHVIRTMEDQLRLVKGSEMFRIVLSPLDASSKELGLAGAQYYDKCYYAIYYHPNTDEKQLRVLLAHELGHLFLLELANAAQKDAFVPENMLEPLSTIFGVFMMLDKSDFYHNRAVPFRHKSADEVLQDFSLIANRSADKLNVS